MHMDYRNTSDGLIEFIRAFSSEGHYFMVIGIPEKEKRRYFQFGLKKSSYDAIQRILNDRQFDKLPGLKYRYFWDGRRPYKQGDEAIIGVRLEQGKNRTSKSYSLPIDLAENLNWFRLLGTLEEASHLEIYA